MQIGSLSAVIRERDEVGIYYRERAVSIVSFNTKARITFQRGDKIDR